MPRCPNCSYKLVLLSHKQRYKCSLCNKIYPKKEIDNKEFREHNKRQKLLDLENYNQEKKQESLKLKQLKKSIKLLFTPLKDNKEYYIEYYQKNKHNIKEWTKQNTLSKEYKQKLKHRLNHYRQQQKRLTLLYLKNCNEELCTIKIFNPLPTYSLSYLLTEIENIINKNSRFIFKPLWCSPVYHTALSRQ